MKNIPRKIYLQIGDECPDDADFNELSEVSWCKDKIYDNDIEFALQNKVSDEEPNKDDIIKEAKRLWKIPNKLEAVKLIIKLGYSLKDAKAYCEDNFDKVSDISAEKIVENHFNGLSDLIEDDDIVDWYKRLIVTCMEEYAFIVNEKDNIPANFKRVTGHDSPKEMVAYEKGREDEQEVIMKWIKEWDGNTNSAMGAILKKKFDERKDNAGGYETSNEVLNEVLGIAVKAHLFQQLNQMDDFIEEIEKFKNFEIRKK